jgi:peroxisomal membrane protein 4
MTHSFAEELHAIVAALVGGARYGVKIRLPHALVMTLLFRRDLTSKEKIQSVVTLAMEHASNLGAFATIYKVRNIKGDNGVPGRGCYPDFTFCS